MGQYRSSVCAPCVAGSFTPGEDCKPYGDSCGLLRLLTTFSHWFHLTAHADSFDRLRMYPSSKNDLSPRTQAPTNRKRHRWHSPCTINPLSGCTCPEARRAGMSVAHENPGNDIRSPVGAA